MEVGADGCRDRHDTDTRAERRAEEPRYPSRPAAQYPSRLSESPLMSRAAQLARGCVAADALAAREHPSAATLHTRATRQESRVAADASCASRSPATGEPDDGLMMRAVAGWPTARRLAALEWGGLWPAGLARQGVLRAPLGWARLVLLGNASRLG